jgi:hypothetical protein
MGINRTEGSKVGSKEAEESGDQSRKTTIRRLFVRASNQQMVIGCQHLF